MSEPDWDQQKDVIAKVIDEFRSNGGKVGGPFQGAPVILLHHRGRKSGEARVSPVVYRTDGESFVVFGSKAGAKTDPDWCRT